MCNFDTHFSINNSHAYKSMGHKSITSNSQKYISVLQVWDIQTLSCKTQGENLNSENRVKWAVCMWRATASVRGRGGEDQTRANSR